MPNHDPNPDHSPKPAIGEPDGPVTPAGQAPLDLSHQQGVEPIQPATDLDCFEADWVFEIHRDKVDSNLIQVRGAQTNHLYFEISGKTDNYSAWQQAERTRDEYRARKLPNFTWGKALELEDCFNVQPDHSARITNYTVVGYQTQFVFFESTDESLASGLCSDLTDLKLKDEERGLVVDSYKALGSFPVRGGELMVGDPTCGMGSGRDVQAVKGVWNGFAVKKDEGDWGKRNTVLLALSKGFTPQPDDTWEEFTVVGVDGGMAAITATSLERDDVDDSFNDGICGGVGVMCSSGYGDGGYGAYSIQRSGLAVAVGIVFTAPLPRYEPAYLDTAVAVALGNPVPPPPVSMVKPETILRCLLADIREEHPEVEAIYLASGVEDNLDAPPVLQVKFSGEDIELEDLHDFVDEAAYGRAEWQARKILTQRDELGVPTYDAWITLSGLPPPM